jgi:23S rRNA (uracil1939-C5)-methyltransferase
MADARVNLAGTDTTLVTADVDRWRPSLAGLVVADPARQGLGARAVERLAGTGGGRLVLVSCDAAALGRDAALLAARGFRLERATLVDLFPHTHHVEVVSRFDRVG